MSGWKQRNPIAFCPFCVMTHEWPVRDGDQWMCAEAKQFDDFIRAEIKRAADYPLTHLAGVGSVPEKDDKPE